MIRKLLIIFIGGAVISLISLGILSQVGGFDWHMQDDGKHGPQATRDLPWTGTETLRIENSAAIVTYTQGPAVKFTVTGPAERIKTLSINGDTVTGTDIHWGFARHSDQIHMNITGPNTHNFMLSGAEELNVANYDQDDFELHISGASSVKATGKAKHAVVDMSGAGHLNLRNLPVDDAKVVISGAGSATLDPKVSADVSISGAAHVRLLTRPTTLHTNISGFGDVQTPKGTTATVGDSSSDDEKDKGKKDKNDNEDD